MGGESILAGADPFYEWAQQATLEELFHWLLTGEWTPLEEEQ